MGSMDAFSMENIGVVESAESATVQFATHEVKEAQGDDLPTSTEETPLKRQRTMHRDDLLASTDKAKKTLEPQDTAEKSLLPQDTAEKTLEPQDTAAKSLLPHDTAEKTLEPHDIAQDVKCENAAIADSEGMSKTGIKNRFLKAVQKQRRLSRLHDRWEAELAEHKCALACCMGIRQTDDEFCCASCRQKHEELTIKASEKMEDAKSLLPPDTAEKTLEPQVSAAKSWMPHDTAEKTLEPHVSAQKTSVSAAKSLLPPDTAEKTLEPLDTAAKSLLPHDNADEEDEEACDERPILRRPAAAVATNPGGHTARLATACSGTLHRWASCPVALFKGHGTIP